MLLLKESDKISAAEWEVFSQYIKPDIPLREMPGGELELLMKKMVAKGYISSYLPNEVVDLGTKASLIPNSASYEIGFPECFSDIAFAGLRLWQIWDLLNGFGAIKLKIHRTSFLNH